MYFWNRSYLQIAISTEKYFGAMMKRITRSDSAATNKYCNPDSKIFRAE